MQDQNIRVVYNWLGPRGPIPNTELPNILQLASVAQSGYTDSKHFWTDSIWHLVFCNKEGFDLGSTHYLNPDIPFIYPIQMTWRIPFDNYFYYGAGIFEYADTPDHVRHLITVRNGFLVIEDSAEAHVTRSHLRVMHDYFQQHRMPLNKVIYLTGCNNAPELYENYCMERGYNRPDQKMIMVPYPISHDSLSSYFVTHKPQVPEYDTERVPEKLFLSWNRRFREHRISMALALDKFGLVDRSYMSMGLVHPENAYSEFPKSIGEFNYYYLSGLGVTDEDVARFRSKLPLVLDGETDTVKMCQDFDDKNRPYYQNSLVSIVTETNFDALEVTLTEKSFKPSKEKHPFIIVGAAGTLKAIRDMGYKTFSEFWDESYDTCLDPRERLTRLINTCNYIASWDDEKIRDFRRRVKPILDHNYERLKIPPSVMVAQQVREKILNVLNYRNNGGL